MKVEVRHGKEKTIAGIRNCIEVQIDKNGFRVYSTKNIRSFLIEYSTYEIDYFTEQVHSRIGEIRKMNLKIKNVSNNK